MVEAQTGTVGQALVVFRPVFRYSWSMETQSSWTSVFVAPALALGLALVSVSCARHNLDTEHLVTRDRGEQYTGLAREDVRRVVQSADSEIQGCYAKERTAPNAASGKLVMKWTTDGAGKVTEVTVQRSLNSSSLENCVAQQIKTWTFPRPSNGSFAEVVYPFFFYPSASAKE